MTSRKEVRGLRGMRTSTTLKKSKTALTWGIFKCALKNGCILITFFFLIHGLKIKIVWLLLTNISKKMLNLICKCLSKNVTLNTSVSTIVICIKASLRWFLNMCSFIRSWQLFNVFWKIAVFWILSFAKQTLDFFDHPSYWNDCFT